MARFPDKAKPLRALADLVRTRQDPDGWRRAQEKLVNGETDKHAGYFGIGSVLVNGYGVYLEVSPQQTEGPDGEESFSLAIEVSGPTADPESKEHVYHGSTTIHYSPERGVMVDSRIDPGTAEVTAGTWVAGLARALQEGTYGVPRSLNQLPTASDLAPLIQIAIDPNGVHGYFRNNGADSGDRHTMLHLPSSEPLNPLYP